MSESSVSSAQANNSSFPGPHTDSDTNSNRQRRKQQRRPAQISSQDARYSHQTHHQQQQQQYQQQQYPQQQQYSQQQQYPQQRYPQPMYYDEYYYTQSAPRGGYNPRNHHQHQQRRPQLRQSSASSQVNHPQVTVRPNSNLSARATNETENLRSTLTEQLFENAYECMICIIKIDRDQEIWSCGICYKMFHLTCVRTWAKCEESGTDKNWRCPGCQYSYSVNPKYTCFCHKRNNPAFQPGEIPHSCGDPCKKRLNTKSNDCHHLCSELCHPGPCPTCTAVTKRSCLCGRESRSVICSSNSIIKCENPCGKLKSCQHHRCNLICHPRECEPCDQLIKQTCLSHGTEREVTCSAETGATTTFTCGDLCGKLLSCGHHQCTKTCHDGSCPDCLLLPENCKTCACGKSTMDNQQRTSCLDPLPTCGKACDRILPCGPIEDRHRCSASCHNGLCPPCDKESTLQCRCAQSTKTASCIETTQYDPVKNPFLCDRRCNKKKLCGKHRCTEPCCDRDVHVCELVCGKTLNCGIHQCEELCHRNACRKCPINIYDELTCRCGQTVLQPPIQCGTQPPQCNYKCNRTHACDHPVYHSCHNEEQCPPCADLVQKMCVGEHTLRHSVPCHLKEVLCGQPCGKPLPCGVHTCQRTCHSGPCQAVEQKCTQRCDIKRRECGHSCNVPCHGHEPCPATTCREIIKAQCPCGRLFKDIVCNVKSNELNEGQDNNDLAQSLAQALSVRTIDLSLSRKQQPVVQQLECDDDCRIVQRNKNLAEALAINLDEPRVTVPVYTDFLRDYAKRNIEFVQTIERQFAQLVEDTQRHRVTKRCHSFKPMKTNERHVIHELGSFYGLETQAMDPEPNRNVVAYASYGMCKLPSVTLSETIRREKAKVPPPVTLI